MNRYVAVFPTGDQITLRGETLTEAHADLRRQLRGQATVGGLGSSTTGARTEVTVDGAQFNVTLGERDALPEPLRRVAPPSLGL